MFYTAPLFIFLFATLLDRHGAEGTKETVPEGKLLLTDADMDKIVKMVKETPDVPDSKRNGGHGFGVDFPLNDQEVKWGPLQMTVEKIEATKLRNNPEIKNHQKGRVLKVVYHNVEFCGNLRFNRVIQKQCLDSPVVVVSAYFEEDDSSPPGNINAECHPTTFKMEGNKYDDELKQHLVSGICQIIADPLVISIKGHKVVDGNIGGKKYRYYKLVVSGGTDNKNHGHGHDHGKHSDHEEDEKDDHVHPHDEDDFDDTKKVSGHVHHEKQDDSNDVD